MPGPGRKKFPSRLAAETLMAVTDPLNVLDNEYRIVWANDARARMHQTTADDLIGKFCYEAFQMRHEPCHDCPVTEARTSGKPCTRERCSLRPDGTRVWTETSAWPLCGRRGEIAYVVEFARNITERKEAEESMQAMNAFRQSVIDCLPDPVMVIDADHTIKLMNRAARETYVPEGAATGSLHCYALSHRSTTPCSDEEHPCPLERVRESGKPVTVVHEHRMADGKKRVVEVSAAPLPGPGGVFRGIIESTRDITRKLADERELALLHAETTRRLDHLTALRSIDMAISSSLDLRVTLDVFLDQVTSNLHVDAAAVLLYQEHSQTLEYTASRGFRSRAICRTWLQMGEGNAGQAALERRIIHIPDLMAVKSFKCLKEAGEQFQAYFAVPLISKGRLNGVLEIFHRGPIAAEPEWLDFLEALSLQASIAIENAALFNNLHRSNIELGLAYNATIEGWARALDIRDKVTEGHSQRVAMATTQIGRAMGMRDDELVHAYRGALLHDIGKLCIPDSILFKPGPLDDEEWKIMRQHPVTAYSLLSTIPYLRQALDIPYCHHEKWDGTGYPNGLKGVEIPLSARIFSVVDVWDALRSDRPYRKALSESEVLTHVKSLAAVHFDPQVVVAFLDSGIGGTCF
jgi:PAS domain S-box-containing protein